MHLVVAEELFVKILQPDEAELQAIGGEPHPAQGKDNGIEGREDREDQNQGYGGRNKKRSGMAVKPLTPALLRERCQPGRSPAGQLRQQATSDWR